MAMHWIHKVSYGAVGVAAAVVAGLGAAASGIANAVRDALAVSTPAPLTPLSQLSPLQVVGGNGLLLQLLGAHFEAKEQVAVFVLPAPESPVAQYLLWMNVETNDAGQFTKSLPVSLPANAPATFYLSARGKRGYVAPIGPLNLPKAAAMPATATPAPVPTTSSAPFQPTLVPPAPPAPPAVATPRPMNPVNKEPAGGFYVEIFNNRDLADAPVITRNEVVVDANWGLGGPAGARGDNFSVRYFGKFAFPETENYEFIIVADDGVRLWVGETMVLNEWRVGPRRELRINVPLTRGEHRLRLEYFDSTGSAQMSLRWAMNYTHWETRYYNTTDWTGPVVLKRDDGNDDDRLHMDLGDRSPWPGLINTDNFSISWERRKFFAVGGEYKFTLELDDGAKVYIDGAEVFNNLNAVGTHEFTRKLGRGRHLMQVLYAEYGGAAKMKLDWTLVPAAPAP